MEDYLIFTTNDPTGVLSVTPNRITGTNVGRNVVALAVRDLGVDYFQDFEHLLTIKDDPGNSVSSVIHYWMLGNDVGDGNVVNGLHLMGVSGGITLRLGEGVGFCPDNNQELYIGRLNVPRYLTIRRVGSNLTCAVYDDEARTQLLGTLSITVATTPYRYVYGFASHNSGQSGILFSGYTENLDLQEPLAGQGTLEVHAYQGVNEVEASVEIVGVGTYLTPFSIFLDIGVYTLNATYGTSTISEIVEILEGIVTEKSFNFLPVTPLILTITSIPDGIPFTIERVN